MQEITFIELFSGIGGFRLGLEKANRLPFEVGQEGFQSDNRQGVSPKSPSKDGHTQAYFRCVWANDNDKYANKIYKKNFRAEELVQGNIEEISTKDIPDHTLLTAGFPCPSFSIAGKRKGFQDSRGTLFFDIARIAKAKRPELLLLENVKGLLSHDEGLTFQIILESLDELGYDVEWQVLNSKHFGVPQNRERVFIIGHLRGGGSRQIFPIGESTKVNTRKPKTQTARTITSQYYKQGQWEQYVRERDRQTDRVYSENGVSPTLNANTGERHVPQIIKKVGNIFPSGHEAGDVLDPSGISETLRPMGPRGSCKVQAPKIALRWVRTERGKEARRRSVREGRDYTPFSNGHRKLVESKNNTSGCITNAVNKDSLVGTIARCLNTEDSRKFKLNPSSQQKANLVFENMRIRRLTPTECERLQGFPDGWTEGVSDTQRYKMLGNAVTVNVIEFLGKRLRKCLS